MLVDQISERATEFGMNAVIMTFIVDPTKIHEVLLILADQRIHVALDLKMSP
jgi:hypothetical protein